jgi:GNAT superfamily N-acetyltransferase
MDASTYSASETLRTGDKIEIRALVAADRAGLLAAVANMSEEARYRRFFAPRRSFSEKEIDFYLHVDFVRHVALVAVLDEGAGPAIVGGGRYIVSEPGRAEVAFGVDDAHHGRGIASLLLRHLALIAREARLLALIAEVLPENAPMLKVFQRSGLPMTVKREGGVVHVTLALSHAAAVPPRDRG